MTTRTFRSRPGPCTLNAVRWVALYPGETKHFIAVRVGPHGSNAYGDRTVLRAMARGLIENRSTDPRRYALFITDVGRAALAEGD